MAREDRRVLSTTITSFEIVEYLGSEGSARVSELARALDLDESTVCHHLATLEQEGYVVHEGNAYHLSLQFLTLGGIERTRRKTYRMAMEKANELAHETGERTQFVVEEDNVGVWIIRVLGSNAVLSDVRIGMRQFLHTTAAGKCILAALPQDRVEEVIDQHGLQALTEHTITSPADLFESLETIRERGYAFNREERIKREQEIGVGILDERDEIIGSLSVSAPSYRWNEEDLHEKLPEVLLEAKNELELEIAYK
jgi:DNA-binding IclR family transcriptional regulator